MTAIGSAVIIITNLDGSTSNIAQSQDTTNIYMETRAFALAGDNVYAFLDSFVPKIKNRIGAAALTLEVWGKNRIGDAAILLASLPLGLNDEPVYPVNPIQSQVYYIFKIIDTALSVRWKLHGFQIFGESDGNYFQ